MVHIIMKNKEGLLWPAMEIVVAEIGCKLLYNSYVYLFVFQQIISALIDQFRWKMSYLGSH